MIFCQAQPTNNSITPRTQQKEEEHSKSSRHCQFSPILPVLFAFLVGKMYNSAHTQLLPSRTCPALLHQHTLNQWAPHNDNLWHSNYTELPHKRCSRNNPPLSMQIKISKIIKCFCYVIQGEIQNEESDDQYHITDLFDWDGWRNTHIKAGNHAERTVRRKICCDICVGFVHFHKTSLFYMSMIDFFSRMNSTAAGKA